MFKARMVLVSVLLISLLSSYNVQATQANSQGVAKYAPLSYGIPNTIAGYKTLAVFSSDDTMCMKAGNNRLILQTTEQSVDTYLLNSSSEEIKNALELQLSTATSLSQAKKDIANWHVEIVGPGVTLERVMSEHQKWDEDAKETGCQTFAPMLSGSDLQEVKTTTHPSPGYAEFEDLDAGTYTDDNAQSVFIVAPSTPNTNEKFHVLNNVRTNGSTFYLLQNGLYLVGSSHHISWTDTTHNYVAQFYSTSYTAGHTYTATISYTGAWQMCTQDNAIPSTWTCIIESSGIGTTLVSDRNTAVWIENQLLIHPGIRVGQVKYVYGMQKYIETV